MYRLFKKFLFLFPPEKAHAIALNSFKIARRLPILSAYFEKQYNHRPKNLKKELMGLTFDNPVGLAAGFDKDAQWIDTMTHLGFGFLEIGTITPKPQAGNPKPRLFRLIRDEALINRMGFNNKGLQQAIENLKKKKSHLIIGGNIGKNKVTPNTKAIDDYTEAFEALFPYVDYFVVNVSSPNTPGLRDLQDKKPLTRILKELQKRNKSKAKKKPILLKIAPDLTSDQCQDIADIIKDTDIDGLICCNTTIRRDLLSVRKERLEKIGNGGLSGAPVFPMALHRVEWFRNAIDPSKVIIAVGGINSPKRASEMLKAGADLLQIYTGIIYEGPGLISKINRHLQSEK